jgi:hypothetical protein
MKLLKIYIYIYIGIVEKSLPPPLKGGSRGVEGGHLSTLNFQKSSLSIVKKIYVLIMPPSSSFSHIMLH